MKLGVILHVLLAAGFVFGTEILPGIRRETRKVKVKGVYADEVPGDVLAWTGIHDNAVQHALKIESSIDGRRGGRTLFSGGTLWSHDRGAFGCYWILTVSDGDQRLLLRWNIDTQAMALEFSSLAQGDTSITISGTKYFPTGVEMYKMDELKIELVPQAENVPSEVTA